MIELDPLLIPVHDPKGPKGPPDNRPPNKPERPTKPNTPNKPPPPSKEAGLVHNIQWPDDVPFPTFRRRAKTPKAPKPPKGLRGTCMVGELLVPVFGRRWVDEVTAHGGLVPYLIRSVAAFFIRSKDRELPALWREAEAYR
jgi:hypothetical protein